MTIPADLCLDNMGHSGALFSRDRVYRYVFWRYWNSKPFLLFIGLNPSTADERTNDPTIRREMGFAMRWGYGGFYKVNLFGYRSPDPKAMKEAAGPIGPDNDWEEKT